MTYYNMPTKTRRIGNYYMLTSRLTDLNTFISKRNLPKKV